MPEIMIIDDSSTTATMVQAELKHDKSCLVVNSDGTDDALSQIENRPPDIIVVDVHTGLELISSVKENYPHIPVIILTSEGTESVAIEALKGGAASFVSRSRLNGDLVPIVLRVLNAAYEDRSHSRLLHYASEYSSRFDIPNNPILVKLLVSSLQESLRCLPLGDENERLRVGIALEAALMNAYFHGNLEIGSILDGSNVDQYWALAKKRSNEQPYADRRVHVTANVSRTRARYEIRDEGPGFDHSMFPNATTLLVPGELKGRGLILMHTFMDEVIFDDMGNQVTMIKHADLESELP